jgi:hypothetical protein
MDRMWTSGRPPTANTEGVSGIAGLRSAEDSIGAEVYRPIAAVAWTAIQPSLREPNHG